MSFLDRLTQPLPSAAVPTPPTSGSVDGVNDELDNLEADADVDLTKVPEDTELSEAEEDEAARIIDLAATSVVLKDALGVDETHKFAESAEFEIACDEGFFLEGAKAPLLESTSMAFLEAGETFLESKFYQKNSVRLTKQSKLNQLFEICVQAIARAKNDAIMHKLDRLQVLRRKYKAILRQRYKTQAMKQSKAYLQRLQKSKSPTLQKAATAMNKK